MKITQIETIRVAAEPRVTWVQVHTAAGIVGLGETYYAPTVVQAAVHDYFGPLLIGRDPFEVERHWEAMFRLSDHARYGGAEMRAISALDMALWDIEGQPADLPAGVRDAGWGGAAANPGVRDGDAVRRSGGSGATAA